MNGERMPEIQFKILCLLLKHGCNSHQSISMLEKIIKEMKQELGIVE